MFAAWIWIAAVLYGYLSSAFAKEILMLSSTNFWMCFAGLIYLVAGIFVLRKEISAARGLDKLIILAPVFIAVPLAIFAPEHFRGPEFVQSMVPRWMSGPHRLWAYFVGCALLAAASSLTVRKFMHLSSTLLGLMFLLFVCMIYLPSALRHSTNRFTWIYLCRDLSFSTGAWALSGLLSRASSPQLSEWMVLYGRIVLAIAAVFYGVQHFLHPKTVPDIPLEKMTPSWVPFPIVWRYFAGAILVTTGIALVLNRRPRMAATSIGAWMIAVTLFLYLPILVIAIIRSTPEIDEALNYFADTLLYAGAALALAAALPLDPDRVET
jgi:uncharacterized membrane protein